MKKVTLITIITIILIVFCFFIHNDCIAAGKTWTADTDGSWEELSNWAPAGVPAASDDVVIPSMGIDPAAVSPVVIASLQIEDGAGFTCDADLSVSGDININGFLSHNSGIVNLTGNNKIVGGSGIIQLNSLNISGVYTMEGDLTITNDLTISGTLTASSYVLEAGGAVDISGSFIQKNTGLLSLSGPNLDITGTVEVYDLNISGYCSMTGNLTIGGALDTSAGSITQTDSGTVSLTGIDKIAGGGVGDNISNLVITGLYTLNGDLSITNDLTSSGTLTVEGYLLEVGGNLTVSGELSSNGALNLTGAGKNLAGAGVITIEDLNIEGSCTLGRNLTVNGILNVNVSGSFNLSNNSRILILSGMESPLINSGTFICGNSTVTYTGIGEVTIADKSNNVEYYDLKIDNAAQTSAIGTVLVQRDFIINAGKLTVQAASNITVTRDITVNGSFSNNASSNIYIERNMTISNSGIYIPGSGNLKFNSGANQVLADNNSAVNNLGNVIVEKNSTMVTATTSLRFDKLTVSSGAVFAHNTGSKSITFAYGSGNGAFVDGTLSINGQSIDTCVTLQSNSQGSQWYLTKNGTVSLNFVNINDCNASGAITAVDSMSSSDNNINVTIISNTYEFQTSGINNWGTAGNWSKNEVPSTNLSRVVIDIANTAVTTGSDYTIGELILGTIASNVTLILGGNIIIDDAVGNNGNLSVGSSGVFDISANNLSIDGSITNSGIIACTAGAITLNGNGKNLSANSTTLLNNLIINGYYTLSGTSLSVAGGITVNSGKKFDLGSGTLAVQGNIVNNGALVSSGDSTIKLSGVDKTLGTNLSFSNVIFSGTYTLTGNITVSKSLIVNAGSVLNIGSNKIIASNGTISNSGLITRTGEGNIIYKTSVSQFTDSSGNVKTTMNMMDDLCYITLEDANVNINGTEADSVNVTITNTSTKDSETVVLTETSPDSGIFRNKTGIPFAAAETGSVNNGKIEVLGVNKIKVEYADSWDSTDCSNAEVQVTGGRPVVIIDPKNGGEASAADDPLTKIIIPAGITDKTIEYNIEKIDIPPADKDSSSGQKMVVSYEIKGKEVSSGVQLIKVNKPFKLLFHRNKNSIVSGYKAASELSSSNFAMGYWNGLHWVPIGSKVTDDGTNILVEANVTLFGKYAIITTSGITISVAPNPFTPMSSNSMFNKIVFSFDNSSSEEAEIKIWDLTGMLVKTLRSTGSITSWDGISDTKGSVVESGIYIYQLKVGGKVSRKGTIVVAK